MGRRENAAAGVPAAAVPGGQPSKWTVLAIVGVGVSNTVTQHGVPLLSYTRTMNRFYNSRRQRLSLGRFKCEVCGERIRFWAWQTEAGTRTHDGCYERLAWTWTNLYAHQQRLAAQGNLE